MRYCYVFLLLGCAPFVHRAAPVPPESDVESLKRIYGVWNDPDKDCKFALKGKELKVSLPTAWHLLWKQRQGSTNNAPRVLREVEGDFTAIVRVTFPIPKRVPEEFWPYCSGGLLAWESDKEQLILRRCGGEVNGDAESIWSQHHSTMGSLNSMTAPGKQSDSVYLRMKREGRTVSAGWSRDGMAWKDFDPAEVGWGARIKVGVVAENCLGTPVEITFDQYSLSQPKK